MPVLHFSTVTHLSWQSFLSLSILAVLLKTVTAEEVQHGAFTFPGKPLCPATLLADGTMAFLCGLLSRLS